MDSSPLRQNFSINTVCRHRSRLQRGATFVETLIALLPVIFLGSLCIELARGYQVRQLLTLSLQDAARVAAVHQGAAHYWQPALRDSLTSLFAPAGRFGSPQARRDAVSQDFHKRFGLPLWRAVRIESEPDIIHLRLTYFYRPMQDWLRTALRVLSGRASESATARDAESLLMQAAWKKGLVPLVIEYRTLQHRSLGQQ